MRLLFKLLLFTLVVAGAGAAAYSPAAEYWKERNRPNWRLAEVSQGRIISVVNSTGEIKPVLSVMIGSFVSGPITDIYVDFNDHVKKGQLLAKVDIRLPTANVRNNEALLMSRRADLKRVEALLKQANNDERRSKTLYAKNKGYISQAEMDKFKFNALSLRAQLLLAQAAIKQAEATLETSRFNLNYTDIRSPIDGIVIDRKINQGQTLAASFQAPELFVIAPDMEKKMHVFASVDESEIGLITKAKAEGRPVQFRVDAWPELVFDGTIEQIRVSSTTTQNVVTYPVVVAAANPELKLFPGMTADITFEVDQRDDVLRVPNSALRFFPSKIEYVREEDRKLVEGDSTELDNQSSNEDDSLTIAEKAAAKYKNRKRHVWVVAGDYLKAVEIEVGLSDGKNTELLSTNLTKGQMLVIDVEPKK